MVPNKSQPKSLAPVINSGSWKLIEEYLAVEEARLVSLLYNCNEQTLKVIQGELKAIKKLQDMPVKLKTEERS